MRFEIYGIFFDEVREMNYTIGSEKILANYFASHENEYPFKIYVDITRDSLLSATVYNPKLFIREGIYIRRGEDATIKYFKNLDENYNWRFPEKIKKDLKKIKKEI